MLVLRILNSSQSGSKYKRAKHPLLGAAEDARLQRPAWKNRAPCSRLINNYLLATCCKMCLQCVHACFHSLTRTMCCRRLPQVSYRGISNPPPPPPPHSSTTTPAKHFSETLCNPLLSLFKHRGPRFRGRTEPGEFAFN